ncbi:IclR family transcriptional regulator [Xenophilus azovorans]|uniref:IclR family transcriptional regulator n=1 Tax=Xenophilus azovorans TaxID=151755 RepID=UPI00056E9931|nr:IclR family transcriptional regulator [Xenophilus azovorans]
MDDLPHTPGAQALRRGLHLLRLLAQNQKQGIRMSDAIELAGLERSTAHRLLSCLVEEGFAEKDERSKRYRLGIDAMQLGSAAVRKMPLVDTMRPIMQRLARISGDTVFFVARDGDEVVCLHREEGPYPIKVFTINIGGRRLLGIGAGGLALMAALEDAEIEDVFARNKVAYEAAGLPRATLWRAVRETRKTGSAIIIETITPGVAGLGQTLPPSLRIPAALSFGTITPRFTPARRTELAALLSGAVKELKSKRSWR